MKISKLTATFGKFNNETISFHEGLNVVYAPNESGKSTWCAFIKAMLYGVETSQRVRTGNPKEHRLERRGTGALPDKQRYAPWSGAPMEGTMDVVADRCDITVTRTTRIKSAPMQEFSAVYTGTATPVKGMTGPQCGEQLTGVSREVFCRSAFVGQGAAALTGSPEMEKRIQSIISTGEEETSFSEAEERLLAWQRKRKFNRKGLIPELERSIEETSAALDDVNRSAEELTRLEEEYSEARSECTGLESAVTEARKRHRREVICGLNDARAEVRRLSDEQNSALAELNDCRDALKNSPFGTRPAGEVENRAERDMEELEQLGASSGSGVVASLLPAIIFFVLALAGTVIYGKYYSGLAVIIAAGIFCIAALFFLFRFISGRREETRCRDRMAEILRCYGAGSPEEIPERVDAHHALCVAAERAAARERETSAAADEAYERLTELENRAAEELDFVSGNSEAAKLGMQLRESRRKASKLATAVAAEESRLNMQGDPVVLRGELNRKKTELEGLRDEYDAIESAVAALREADDEIQSRFSPRLGEVAAEYMSFVTGGKYENVMLGRDFSAKTKTRDDAVARDSGYLSAGTVDLLYLAVRLAVCELAMPSGEPCPLIIDDALVNLDEERYGQAMKLLARIARQRQVILFTCRQPGGGTAGAAAQVGAGTAGTAAQIGTGAAGCAGGTME